MKRSTLISILLIATVGITAVFAAVNHLCTTVPKLNVAVFNPTVIINDKQVDFEKLYGRPILNVHGRTMLPLRAFAYYIFNHDPNDKEHEIVFYEQEANDPSIRPDHESINHIWIEKDGYRVDFWEGYQYISVKRPDDPNTYIMKTDVPPLVMDEGYTYLPFRVQAYALGYGVTWDEKTKTIFIHKHDCPHPTVGEPVVFEPVKGYTTLSTKRGSVIGPGVEEIFPLKWDGKDNGYITAKKQDDGKLPYQKYIDSGLLKYHSGTGVPDKDHVQDPKSYIMPTDKFTKENVFKLAYDPALRQDKRLIVVEATFNRSGVEDGCILYDYGLIEDMLAGKTFHTAEGPFNPKSPESWEWIACTDTISINGVPWQDTEYRDVILEAIKKQIDRIAEMYGFEKGAINDPYYLDIILDKNNNGYTYEKLCRAQGDSICLDVGSNEITVYKSFKKVNPIKLPFKVFKDKGEIMLPLKPVIQSLGGQLSAENGTIIIKHKWRNYQMKLGSNTITVDGETKSLSKPLYEKYGYTFITASDFKKYFKNPVDISDTWCFIEAGGGMFSKWTIFN